MTSFERGWQDAESGRDFFRNNPFDKRCAGDWIAWRNGFREFYLSIGIKLCPFVHGYSEMQWKGISQ